MDFDDIDPEKIHSLQSHPGEDTVHHLALRLERAVHQDGWDVQPKLMLALETSPHMLHDLMEQGLIEASTADSYVAGAITVSMVELPTEVLKNFSEGLPQLADFMCANLPLGAIPLKVASMNSHVVAIVCVSEGWVLTADKNDPAAVADMARTAGARQIHAHPKRREGRILLLITRDRRHIGVTRLRGENDAVDEVTLIDHEKDQVPWAGGTIPHALEHLAEIAFDLPTQAQISAAAYAIHAEHAPEEIPTDD
jgi:hypothetical protein